MVKGVRSLIFSPKALIFFILFLFLLLAPVDEASAKSWLFPDGAANKVDNVGSAAGKGGGNGSKFAAEPPAITDDATELRNHVDRRGTDFTEPGGGSSSDEVASSDNASSSSDSGSQDYFSSDSDYRSDSSSDTPTADSSSDGTTSSTDSSDTGSTVADSSDDAPSSRDGGSDSTDSDYEVADNSDETPSGRDTDTVSDPDPEPQAADNGSDFQVASNTDDGSSARDPEPELNSGGDVNSGGGKDEVGSGKSEEVESPPEEATPASDGGSGGEQPPNDPPKDPFDGETPSEGEGTGGGKGGSGDGDGTNNGDGTGSSGDQPPDSMHYQEGDPAQYAGSSDLGNQIQGSEHNTAAQLDELQRKQEAKDRAADEANQGVTREQLDELRDEEGQGLREQGGPSQEELADLQSRADSGDQGAKDELEKLKAESGTKTSDADLPMPDHWTTDNPPGGGTGAGAADNVANNVANTTDNTAAGGALRPPETPVGNFDEELKAAEQALSQNLGREVEISFEPTARNTGGELFDFRVWVKDEDGNPVQIGSFEGGYSNQGNDMVSSSSYTDDAYRDQRINSWLFRLSTARYPDMDSTHAMLNEVNLDVYNKARAAGDDIETAIKKTPRYKTNARQGFTEISEIEEDLDLETIFFRMSKKKPEDG